jgi:hypothetical protein
VIEGAREVTPPRVPDGSDGEDDWPFPPVKPLGHNNGVFYALDAANQHRAIERFGRSEWVKLAGAYQAALIEAFPRRNGDGDVVGFRPELFESKFVAACHRAGFFDPGTMLRGPGAHRGDAGELIYHCGDAVWDGHQFRKPGRFGEFLYPAAPSIPAPWENPVAPTELEPLRDAIASFAWKRPINADLFLGQLAALMIGGALPWRPSVWCTGPRGSGKSSLQQLAANTFGRGAIAIADATAAGLRQALKFRTIPLLLDEFEPAEDNRRNQEIIKLIRNSASGAFAVRGGGEHDAQEFILRSAVLCTSILVPPLLPQDASRVVILRVGKPDGRRAPDLSPATLAPLGRKILRRLFDHWPRFDQAFHQFRGALFDVGHDARGADVYAAILGCRDLLLSNHEVDGDSAGELARLLLPSATIEAGEELGEEQRWLMHLLTKTLPLDGPGPKYLVSEWLRRANSAFYAQAEEADAVLGAVGIKVIRPKGPGKPTQFAIANYHAGAQRLFEGTHWGGKSGALGVWAQVARQFDHAKPTKQRFAGGVPSGGTALPLAYIWPHGFEADAPPAQASLAEVEED